MKYRKAVFADVESIFHLVNDYAADGAMLARSRNTLYETLRDMIVAEDDAGRVVGVGGLHMMWDRMAEIRTMAVAPEFARCGIGSEIVRRLMAEGSALGVRQFFTLTYKPGFFKTLGFQGRAAAEGREGMHRLSQVSELRRNRHGAGICGQDGLLILQEVVS